MKYLQFLIIFKYFIEIEKIQYLINNALKINVFLGFQKRIEKRSEFQIFYIFFLFNNCEIPCINYFVSSIRFILLISKIKKIIVLWLLNSSA